MKLKLDVGNLKGHVDQNKIEGITGAVETAHKQLESGSGLGCEFTGWLRLPELTSASFLTELKTLGEDVRSHSDCIVSIGIGGSYLGIKASLEFLAKEKKLPVYFAGHNMSSGYMLKLLETLQDKQPTVIVISKSGTTTEPALAFRLIKQFMQNKYGPQEMKKRIICVTDEKKGALRAMADRQGYQTYPIADDVGGRFSVLSPVGLVPLALAGVDIQNLINGALTAQKTCSKMDLKTNPAYQYAAARFLLYKSRKNIEIMASFDDRLHFISEWWKQLYGESEGKNGKGIFPASVDLTADLHSMGQMIQEGERNLFETFLQVEESKETLKVPFDQDNLDNFNCVADKNLDWVNFQAYRATAQAHFEGGVPNMTITVPGYDAQSLGELYYFFEKGVAVSGYLAGVNPFDQPGVEAYKTKMFALLGRQ